MKAYHFTSKKNLKSILKKGLIPKIGHRSKAVCEPYKAIYLLENIDEAYDLLSNHLYDYFPKNTQFILLEVNINDFVVRKTCLKELLIFKPISPSNIKVVNLNFLGE